MKRKKFAVILAATAFLMLNSCVSTTEFNALKQNFSRLQAQFSDGKYDNNNFMADPAGLSKIIDSTYQLKAVVGFKMTQEDGRMQEETNWGSAVVIGNRYVLTCCHVISIDTVTVRFLGPLGPFSRRISPDEVGAEKIGKESAFLVTRDGKKIELKELYRNEENDIAILELPEESANKISSFPYPIGNANELTVGNYVLIAGNPFSKGAHVRNGIISAAEMFRDAIPKVKSENLFVFSIPIFPGDSGAPIIAVRDGVYELVGLAEGGLSGTACVSWGTKINSILSIMGELDGK